MKAVVLFLLLLTSFLAFSQGESHAYVSRARSFFQKKQFKEAALYADSARMAGLRTDNIDSLESLFRWFSSVHLANKDYEAALADIKVSMIYRDSIARRKLVVVADEWKTKLEDQEKSQHDLIQRQADELLTTKVLAQRNERNAIIVFGSVLVLMGVGLLGLNRKRIQSKRAHEQALASLAQLQSFKEKLFTVLTYDLAKSLAGFENLTQSLSSQMNTFSREESVQVLKQLHSTAGEFRISIDNIIHWIAYQANAKPFHPVYFDIKLIAERGLAKFQWPLSDKQLECQVFVPKDQFVYADQEMVEIILTNLIANAIQFTHSGGTITCFSGNKDGLVLIGIKDTGIGISEENRKKLFESSEDLHAVGKAGHKGSGVGLILAKELVERNGGRIYVESTVGQGSTFYFTLPEKKYEGG